MSIKVLGREWGPPIGYWILGITAFLVGVCYSETGFKGIIEMIEAENLLWIMLILMCICSFAFIFSFLKIRKKGGICDREDIVKVFIIICVVCLLIGVILLIVFEKVWVWYGIAYSCFCSFSILAYLLFSFYKMETLKRLSFCILYPSILTIGLNFYFGISFVSLRKNLFRMENLPFLILALYFLLVVTFEIIDFSVKRLKPEVSKIECSTIAFVSVSLFIFLVSIVCFYISSKGYFMQNLQTSFANLLFSIAIALYLGIYEGWDALGRMEIEESRFARHYRWWTFLQVCYPLAFFFVITIVDSDIFTYGIVIAFAVISVLASVVWKSGGAKGWYDKEKNKAHFWSWWKIVFGLVIMVGLIFNKQVIMGKDWIFNVIPEIDVKEINAELIIFFLGSVSSFFITASNKGEKYTETKKFLLAIPFDKDVKMNEFKSFCKDGFFYDFTNYMYLIYLILIHILIIDTKLIKASCNNRAHVVKIFVLLSVIVYMFLSFICKFASVEGKKHGRTDFGG